MSFQFYGSTQVGFANFWTTLTSLTGMLRGTYNFFPLLAVDQIFTHVFFYSFYAFAYGMCVGLILAILNDSYHFMKKQMYYKSTLDLQDYEMIEFMMKRFKLWAGIDKPKPVRQCLCCHYRIFCITFVNHSIYY